MIKQLTDAQIVEFKRMYEGHVLMADIASHFHVCTETIYIWLKELGIAKRMKVAGTTNIVKPPMDMTYGGPNDVMLCGNCPYWKSEARREGSYRMGYCKQSKSRTERCDVCCVK